MNKHYQHTLFLKWWLFAVLMSMTFVALAMSKFFHVLWDKDVTKLSFVLVVLFVSMSTWCGYKTFRLSKFLDDGRTENHLVEKIEHLIEVGWFTSDLCLTIGMIGTVTGFIMMLSGFTSVDIGDIQTIQDLIKKLGLGMSTALYSTLVGLICSSLLKIQYFNLSQAIDRVRDEA